MLDSEKIAEMEGENYRLRQALHAIADDRYRERFTMTPDNAWVSCVRLNRTLLEIYDQADKALVR